MTWDDVRIFLALARAGSIARAAKALHLDAATVSRRLGAFERAVGAALVVRRRDGVTLTPEGETVRALAEQAEAPLRALERPLVEPGASGAVRLATSGILSVHVIAAHVPAFLAAWPELRLELTVARRLVELARGEADVALRLRPAGAEVAEPSVVALKLADVGFALYASTAAPGAARIRYLGSDLGRDLPADRHPNVVVDELPTALALVRAGVGSAVLPCFMGDREPGLTRASAVLEHHRLFVATLADLRKTPRVEAVFEWLRGVAETERARLSG